MFKIIFALSDSFKPRSIMRNNDKIINNFNYYSYYLKKKRKPICFNFLNTFKFCLFFNVKISGIKLLTSFISFFISLNSIKRCNPC